MLSALAAGTVDPGGSDVASWLAGLEFTQIGFSTIGIIAVLGLLRGWLITAREHRETRADRDTWRNTALETLATVASLSKQNEELIKAHGLTTAVVQGLDTVVETRKAAQ